MLPLPPILPDPAFRASTRLPRDHYVRVLSSDYSVAPWAIGRRVEVRADLDEVVVSCAGREVARHRRSLVPHQVITDPAHRHAAHELRTERRELVASPGDFEIEVRDLAAYDRLAEAVS